MKKVRYAVVGAGWISQEAFLPGVWQTENSVVSAIVTGSEEKGRRLAEFHQVPHVFGYEQYAGMLNEDVCDAVYVALPNSMHAEYTIQAAKAGKHILVEKPLAVSLQEGKAMIEAAEENSVYLMTAYRLHSEPGTVEALERIRHGQIGEPRIFNSILSFQIQPENHRLQSSLWGDHCKIWEYIASMPPAIFLRQNLQKFGHPATKEQRIRFLMRWKNPLRRPWFFQGVESHSS